MLKTIIFCYINTTARTAEKKIANIVPCTTVTKTFVVDSFDENLGRRDGTSR
jgi:hypothetical protein